MEWIPLSQESGESYLHRLQNQSVNELLGISENADSTELKLAYRRMVAKYHPDRLHPFLKPHSDRVMRLINAAYEQECKRRGI